MTATLTLPLVAWGTPDDMTSGSWSTPAGTLAAITTTTDPFGGSLAYTLNDTDGAVASRRQRNIAVTTDGVHALFVAAKAGTAAESQVIILETTGGNVRGSVTITWSGPTFTAGSGGTFYGGVALGNSWYGGILLCAGLTVANGPAIAYRPSGATGSATGSASFYVRNIALLSYLDGATSWPEPRKGSAWAEAPSATEDAWIVGTNWHLAGTVRHVPDSPTDTPEVVSGWYGLNESTGVNCGVAALLTAGRDKQTLTWAKDRATCTTYTDGYLVEPMRGRPDLEPNWRRQFPLELRSTSVYAGY